MAAGAIAVAVGSLIGGFATTYFSWRWVFAGEVSSCWRSWCWPAASRTPHPRAGPKLDLVGTVLSATGLGLAVFGVLRSSEWGWIQPKPDGPELLGVSPTVWLILGGLFVVWLFLRLGATAGEAGRRAAGPTGAAEQPPAGRRAGAVLPPVPDPGGPVLHHPLYLSVALGLSAIDTGVRILPLSITLLAAAAGIPRFSPTSRPGGWSAGLLAMLAAGALFASIDPAAGPRS